MIAAFEQRIGRASIGNVVASGTAIIDELGPEHMRTGAPIVYTSADSVFQIAAHEDVVPVPTLYRVVRGRLRARGRGRWGSAASSRGRSSGGRARSRAPPTGTTTRMPPIGETLLDRLTAHGPPGDGDRQDQRSVRRPRASARPFPTTSDDHGMDVLSARLATQDARADLREPRRLRHAVRPSQRRGRLRRQPRAIRRAAGGAAAGAARRTICWSSPPTTATIPTTPSTDHSREHVPLLVSGRARAAGRRPRDAHRRSPISGRPWPRCSAWRRWRTARASSRAMIAVDDSRTTRAARARDPRAAGRQERREPRAAARRRPRMPIRPAFQRDRDRIIHTQGVPPAEAQDAGVLLADRRSLPHAADAHARGVADRPHHRQGAAPARGADRGDRARPRSRPHAVRPRRRAGARARSCPAASTTTSRACASSTCSRTIGRG